MNVVESCTRQVHRCAGRSVSLEVRHGGLDLRENPTHTVILQDLLELRDLVARQLWARGTDVVTDREVDHSLAYAQAMRLGYVCPDRRLALHVHAGLFPATGVLCLAPPAQRVMAQSLAQTMTKAMGLSPHLAGFWQDVLSRDRRLAFCHGTAGIVVECFFLTNATERQHYATHKEHVAAAIAGTLLGSQCRQPYSINQPAWLAQGATASEPHTITPAAMWGGQNRTDVSGLIQGGS